MEKHNLENYVEKFKNLKKELLNLKLAESDASLLASRLLEVPAGIPKSLYFHVKQNERFRPYIFNGLHLSILKISISGEEGQRKAKVELSMKWGIVVKRCKLSGNQALLFLTLMCMKYKSFEQDAMGGFPLDALPSDAHAIADLASGFKEFGRDDVDNLKARLRSIDLGELVEKNDGMTRLSVAPNHVAFESEAREIFDQISGKAIDKFQSAYGHSVLTVGA